MVLTEPRIRWLRNLSAQAGSPPLPLPVLPSDDDDAEVEPFIESGVENDKYYASDRIEGAGQGKDKDEWVEDGMFDSD